MAGQEGLDSPVSVFSLENVAVFVKEMLAADFLTPWEVSGELGTLGGSSSEGGHCLITVSCEVDWEGPGALASDVLGLGVGTTDWGGPSSLNKGSNCLLWDEEDCDEGGAVSVLELEWGSVACLRGTLGALSLAHGSTGGTGLAKSLSRSTASRTAAFAAASSALGAVVGCPGCGKLIGGLAEPESWGAEGSHNNGTIAKINHRGGDGIWMCGK